ncbi:MAG: hypothetical protein ABSD71_14625 [Bacteroidales bacterium]|jgi:hypothetical protein
MGIQSDGNLGFGQNKIPERTYLCPLCMKGFYESDLDQNKENPLTLEDLPPKSIGNKLYILTCKKCNNESGYNLDYLIKQQLSIDPFLKGTINSGITANFNLGDNRYAKGKLNIIGEEQLHFDILSTSNQFLKTSFNRFINDKSKAPFTIKYPIPNNQKLNLAYLRIGYLIFFNYFGYLALFDKNLKMLREQLSMVNDYEHTKVVIIRNLENKNVSEGAYIIKAPEYLKAYLVIIKTTDKITEKEIGIVIPGPGEEGLNCYNNFFLHKESNKIEMINVSYKDLISKIETIDAYHTFYKDIN